MNPVLVDSSVWIAYFRDTHQPDLDRLDVLIKSDAVCLTHVIRAELLSGVRTVREYRRLKTRLSAVQLLSDSPRLWDRVALARFRLARRGIQASMLDLSIAVQASLHHCMLFTLDKQFETFPKVMRLRLY